MRSPYTYAKSWEANHRLESWNLAEPPIHELSNYDKPQNIAFSGVWDLPFGRNRHWLRGSNKLIRGVVSGSNANWIYTYYSRYPVGVPNVQFSFSSYIVRPQTPDHWFNNDTTCYKRSGVCEIGRAHV